LSSGGYARCESALFLLVVRDLGRSTTSFTVVVVDWCRYMKNVNLDLFWSEIRIWLF